MTVDDPRPEDWSRGLALHLAYESRADPQLRDQDPPLPTPSSIAALLGASPEGSREAATLASTLASSLDPGALAQGDPTAPRES